MQFIMNCNHDHYGVETWDLSRKMQFIMNCNNAEVKSMDLPETLKQIVNYRKSGENWYRLADIIREVSRSEAWRANYNSNADWLKEAAKLSGHHPAVIRRMIRAMYFLDRMVEHEGIVFDNNGNIPLASLEILERMYPIDSKRTKELVGNALNGKVTLREVQKEYDNLVAKHLGTVTQNVLVIGPSKIFHKRAANAIHKSISFFTGKSGKVIEHKYGSMLFPLGVDIISICNNVNIDKEIYGFHIEFSTDGSMNNRGNILQSVAFSCEFFTRYWVILPEYSGIELQEYLSSRLNELELYNVAFAFLNNQPKSEDPEDLWHMTKSVFRPDISSHREEGFFPSENEFVPKWKNILSKHIN